MLLTFEADEASSMRSEPLSEMERNRSIELDSATAPKYEVSDSESQVCWQKDDTEPLSNNGLNIQNDGNVRNGTIQSTELSDTRPFICGNLDEAVSFKTDSQGDFPVTLKIQTNYLYITIYRS